MKDPVKTLGSTWHLRDRLPCRWLRVDFQPRDTRLLKVMLEQKFLSWPQIVDYLFDGKGPYAYRRVWKLRRFGLVQKLLSSFTGSDLYLATEAAHDLFHNQYIELPESVGLPDLRTISHDLLVTDIRFLFERIGFGSLWTSERMWRMGRSVRLWAPDAVVQVGEESFALEVECVQKMDQRYNEIFSRYQEDFEIAACLYVAEESLLTGLMERARDFPKIYFTSQADLFARREKAAFKNSKGRFIALEDNLEKKPLPKESR